MVSGRACTGREVAKAVRAVDDRKDDEDARARTNSESMVRSFGDLGGRASGDGGAPGERRNATLLAVDP